LHAFARSLECTLVVTQPDRPAGRGRKLQASAVKLAARALGLPTIEPERVREALGALRAAEPDVYAVASYGKILPQVVLDAAPRGAFNVHPSLLPLYRGATPLQSQLRDGVTQSGVSIILMDAGMDTGDIVLQRPGAIGASETYGELHDRFAALGADALAEACAGLAAATLTRTPQAGLESDDAVARTSTRPLTKDDLLLDWRWSAKRIVDHVRAFAPRPGARARLDGEAEMVKILKARAVARPAPGELAVPCGQGQHVALELLVPANRKPMSGTAYLASGRAVARST